ncbi:MAG TPA: tetratricopeptide repeat protein [Nitrospirota bacterium]|nr:tetratricopeptide repeat protein [Nitrospirota bacterium]
MAIDKNTVAKEAQKYAAKGQYDKAIAEWKRLLKESPHDANLYNTIGDLCLKKNSKPEAVDAYRHAADILAQDGFTSKAIALYKKVLNIDNNQIEVHLALGDMHAEKGLTGNALENYKHVADLYTQKKDTVKALSVYQKMADLNPANIAFRIKLADMYAKQGMKAEAAAAYLSAADVHIEKEALTDARQLFEKVLAFDPNNKQVYYKAGILYLKEGKFSEACKALKPVYETDPADRELLNTYTDALTRAGKDQDAEHVLRKALADDPGRTDLQEKLYEIYLARKDYDRALTAASALSATSMEREDPESAEGYLKKFITACPHVPAGRLKLAEFYISIRWDEDAAKSFLRAAEIMCDEGNRDGAKDALDRALEIHPGMPDAMELLRRLSTEVAPQEPAQDSVPQMPVQDSVPQMPAQEAVQEPEQDAVLQEIFPGIPAQSPPVDEPEPVPAEPAAQAPPAEFLSELAESTDAVPFPEIPDAGAAGAAPPVEEPRVEKPAAPVEDPAIVEALTEADVLIKYGLAIKAVEHLEGLAKKHPHSATVRVKLQHMYGDMGQMKKAAQHMIALADIYAGQGRTDEAAETLRSALEIDPANSEVAERLSVSPQAAPAAPESFEPPASGEALTPDAFPQAGHEPAPTDMNVFDSFDTTPALEEPQPVDLAPVLEESAQPPLTEDVHTGQHGDSENIEAPLFGTEQEQAFAEEQPFTAELGEEPSAAELPAEAPPAGAPLYTQRTPAAPDIDEIWAEAEFYYQQGLFDEAKKHYARIIEMNPSDARAITRLSEISREEEDTREFTRLADAVESLEEAITTDSGARELPLSASDEEAVRNLMTQIAGIKKPQPPKPASKPMIEVEYIPPPPKTEPPEWQRAEVLEEAEVEELPSEEPGAGGILQADTAPTQDRGSAVAKTPIPPQEEEFFDLGEVLKKETSRQSAASQVPADDFFDLASELRDELSTVAVPENQAAPAEEQSLDEIFEEFKRGVEQQSTKEESDTHYNLGVAYREMGLLDDAIEEFSLTPQGEQKFMVSRHMLGLCYMEKGDYVSAIRELEYALTYSEGMGEDDKSRVEMRYDLGLAYQGAGKLTDAMREFQAVQKVNPRYRDVAAKMIEFNKGDSTSMSQLKGDIQKEISSKFLQEGERIEREEKSRKNERVRH